MLPLQMYLVIRGGSRTATTSKMEHFVIIVNGLLNYYHKVLHLGCCSSPRSASGYSLLKADDVLEELKY